MKHRVGAETRGTNLEWIVHPLQGALAGRVRGPERRGQIRGNRTIRPDPRTSLICQQEGPEALMGLQPSRTAFRCV